ncbi:sigma-70 family RNA polymerase sigma factor family protein [Amycolatopsis eburnea]|uniref:Siderophore-interacting protein n=1 Tax=Amycolatopsis eburnea TaxID=2267691 RepID=A0A3R9ELV9_9PSEU|nr:siderophore-interacting protein [Amycolatopsis eburnea]RSD11907.1 siderophore-interacting protein [Amycolatopsis eburnea]
MLDPQDATVRRFAAACRRRDGAALEAVLGDDAVATCDGGGLVPAPGSVRGAAAVARLVIGIVAARAGAELTVESVNGRAGLALRHASRAVAVIGAETAGARITTLWIVLNPAKLTAWHRG